MFPLSLRVKPRLWLMAWVWNFQINLIIINEVCFKTRLSPRLILCGKTTKSRLNTDAYVKMVEPSSSKLSLVAKCYKQFATFDGKKQHFMPTVKSTNWKFNHTICYYIKKYFLLCRWHMASTNALTKAFVATRQRAKIAHNSSIATEVMTCNQPNPLANKYPSRNGFDPQVVLSKNQVLFPQ